MIKKFKENNYIKKKITKKYQYYKEETVFVFFSIKKLKIPLL